jgi:hypothetical protein
MLMNLSLGAFEGNFVLNLRDTINKNLAKSVTIKIHKYSVGG